MKFVNKNVENLNQLCSNSIESVLSTQLFIIVADAEIKYISSLNTALISQWRTLDMLCNLRFMRCQLVDKYKLLN